VCVCDIHESLQISQPKASRHLAYLRRAGLVTDRKKGLWVHYRLAPQHDPELSELLAAVARSIAALPQAGRDLERLAHRTGCCARSEQDGWTSPAST
jgi:ArsR family transcriptional regulator, arsenate/arsenite/antimonite-responsive transcriptional repressor